VIWKPARMGRTFQSRALACADRKDPKWTPLPSTRSSAAAARSNLR
jgi:hypothetical protein